MATCHTTNVLPDRLTDSPLDCWVIVTRDNDGKVLQILEKSAAKYRFSKNIVTARTFKRAATAQKWLEDIQDARKRIGAQNRTSLSIEKLYDVVNAVYFVKGPYVVTRFKLESLDVDSCRIGTNWDAFRTQKSAENYLRDLAEQKVDSLTKQLKTWEKWL